MGAPDKIYVNEYQDGYYSTCWNEKPHVLAHELESIGMKAVCYIRKDTLIKWLDGKMTIEGATEGFVGGYDTALKDVIDKLNSM